MYNNDCQIENLNQLKRNATKKNKDYSVQNLFKFFNV